MRDQTQAARRAVCLAPVVRQDPVASAALAPVACLAHRRRRRRGPGAAGAPSTPPVSCRRGVAMSFSARLGKQRRCEPVAGLDSWGNRDRGFVGVVLGPWATAALVAGRYDGPLTRPQLGCASWHQPPAGAAPSTSRPRTWVEQVVGARRARARTSQRFRKVCSAVVGACSMLCPEDFLWWCCQPLDAAACSAI